MVDLSVKVGAVALHNPIMPASGTFSNEFAQVIDLNRLGALVTKTVSRPYRPGNPPPRVHEIEAGMINSIGLPTKGLEYFLEVQLPEYRRYKPPTDLVKFFRSRGFRFFVRAWMLELRTARCFWQVGAG